MTIRTAKPLAGRITVVPGTTPEEIPVLNDQERAELLVSLREAEAQIDAGQGVDYDSATFKERLARIYRAP